MKYSFYESFVKNLYNSGFSRVEVFGNIFMKVFEGIAYFVFPILDFQDTQDINNIIKNYENLFKENFYNLNVNKVLFLKIFIFDEMQDNFFENIENNFDIHSEVLSVDWSFDCSKNEVFVRKDHISKILNLQELLKLSMDTNNSFKTSVVKSENNRLYFENKKLFLTFSLILVNIIVYIYINIINSNIFETLVRELAISPRIFYNNEFYRLFTAMFLHADFGHLISNSLSLYIFGSLVERFVGKLNFIICYFVGGIIGGALSAFFNSGLSIGASGAIFAIEGALIYFYLRERDNFKNLNLYTLCMLIIINIFIGTLNPKIDNIAHIGGFLGGFILSIIIYEIKKIIRKK